MILFGQKPIPMPNFRGVRFTNAHETLIWAQKEQGAHYTFNHHAMKALNEDLQMRSDWSLSICSGGERLKKDGKKLHPTQKPEALLYRVSAFQQPGRVMLSSIHSLEPVPPVRWQNALHRHFIGIERDPEYAAAARERITEIHQVEFNPPLFVTPDPRKEVRIPFGTLVENGMLQAGQLLFFGEHGKKSLAFWLMARWSIMARLDPSIRSPVRFTRRQPMDGIAGIMKMPNLHMRICIHELRKQLRQSTTPDR